MEPFVVGRHGQRRHVDVIGPSSKGCARMIERPCIMFEAGGRGVHKVWEGSVLFTIQALGSEASGPVSGDSPSPTGSIAALQDGSQP